MKPLRRLCVALLLAVTTSVVLAGPVSADAPTAVTAVRSFDALNPCTGEAHVVTLNSELSIHNHSNNTVVKSFTSLTASDGWIGDGQDTQVLVNARDEIIINVNLMVSDPTSGQKFRVSEGIRVDLLTGTLDYVRRDIVCVGK